MPTQQFDGPTLEAALAKVREELGPDARIVSADKVRTGGIAGFFSKERVEVTAEPGDPSATSTPTVPSAPASLLDLADSISDAEHLNTAGTAGAVSTSLSTESSSFASVLQRIAGEADVALAAQTAIDPPALGAAPVVADDDDNDPWVVDAPADTFSFAPQPEVAPEPETQPEPANNPLAAFAALAKRTVRDPEPEPELEMVTEPEPEIAMVTEREAEPEMVTEPEPEIEMVTEPDSSPMSAALAVPAYVRDLERLGMPGALVPPYADDDLFDALVDRLELLPYIPTLPHTKGTVLVVVGPRAEALDVARELAVEVRTHPRDIVIYGAEGSTVEDIEEHRRSWRRRLEPTVVVVDAPVAVASGTAAFWVRDVIAALEPHSVWGVVDGGRKIEDLAAWSDAVGGVDALAVTGVLDTLTPASVLHLGLPVAMIDGEPASPELWAEILMDRIAA